MKKSDLIYVLDIAKQLKMVFELYSNYGINYLQNNVIKLLWNFYFLKFLKWQAYDLINSLDNAKLEYFKEFDLFTKPR